MMKAFQDRGSFLISLPTAKFDPSYLKPLSIEIVQEARHHDAAVIRYKSRLVDWRNTLAPGTPVSVQWKSQTSPKSQFYGYITHVKPLQKHDDYYRFDVYAVGASRVLRATSQDMWRNISAPQLAAKVARNFGLKPVVIDHPMRKPQIAQAGRSYWEMLADLANQIGYAMWVNGTTLYFLPISTMVSSGFKEAQILSAMNSSNKSKTNPEYALLDFTSVTGLSSEMSDYSGDQIDVSALTPTAQVASRKRPGTAVKRQRKVSSPYVNYLQDQAVYSKRDADSLAQGQADNGLMAIDAHVESEGTAGMRPYAPVYLETQNSATSGWWIVKSVRHRMTSNEQPYICESVLSTDSIYPSSSKKPRGLQNLLSGPPATEVPKPAKTVLRASKFSPIKGRTSDVGQAYQWRAV